MKSNLAAGNIAVALLIVAIVGLRTHCPLSTWKLLSSRNASSTQTLRPNVTERN
jgi:hypothetical protein